MTKTTSFFEVLRELTRREKLILILCAFLFFCLSSGAFAGMAMTPGMAEHVHSDANTGGGTLALSGTLSSTKACASGFTRISANYCQRTNGAVINKTVSASGCGQTTALTGVTDAKAVVFNLKLWIVANNAISGRTINFNSYAAASTTCFATAQAEFFAYTQEYVATAAGTTIFQSTSRLIAETTSTGVANVNAVTLCTGCVVHMHAIGYYD